MIKSAKPTSNLAAFTLALGLGSVSLPALSLENGDSISPQTQAKIGLDNTKQVSIVDFFASWCVSCRIEVPLLSQLNTQIDQSKVEIIGVDVDEDPAEREAFLNELRQEGLSFRVVNDQNQSVVDEFSPVGMPALYYVVDGKVIGARIGAIEHIDQVVAADLAELGIQ